MPIITKAPSPAFHIHNYNRLAGTFKKYPTGTFEFWAVAWGGSLRVCLAREKATPIPIYDNRDEAATHLWPILMGGSLKRSLGMAANARHWLNMYVPAHAVCLRIIHSLCVGPDLSAMACLWQSSGRDDCEYRESGIEDRESGNCPCRLLAITI